ncbi:MAG: cell division protein [uncultured bacterium]|nr:MAG: cell division protein [uncultured bacterium]
MRILIALLSIVIFSGLIFAFQLSRKNARNRYRKSRFQKAEPTLGKNPLDNAIEEDTDDILGLKTDILISKENTAPTPPVRKSEKNLNQDVFIALYLMAPKNSVYGGYELLQALLSAGLRFGEQRIFHRHEQKDGRGKVLFHCASAVAPGIFDLSKMGGFTSPGLCLFFSVNNTDDSLAVFDAMLATIDQLVEDLSGEVLDEHRKPFNKEKMIQLRQIIRSAEVDKTTMDMFELAENIN